MKEKLRKEDLDNSLELLTYSEKKLSDVNTTHDYILFLEEAGWVCVVDVSEKGDLENGVVIREFTKSYEMKKINSYLSVSINVYENGNVLEVVGMCCKFPFFFLYIHFYLIFLILTASHGTHVASIASGNHTENNDLDGCAPGAKIFSFTIGDGRLGSMETGTALIRAIIKVMEFCKTGRKIDVINMSYGEHGHWSNSGRVGELMNELINKFGVVWVASAGNHGPALCTIGTPPDIQQSNVVGVGAYVSPDMMEAEYALREKLPGNVYSWTSRDPCIDGGAGVTVCAPGGAIASVPEFTLSKAQLMNGTSMAAPHVAGAIALLISGLKQNNVTYSPYSIKRALWNSATRISYVCRFAQGNGLLNVEKAFDLLMENKEAPEINVRFTVSVGNNADKGIHIRQGVLKKQKNYNVTIEPVFFNEKETNPMDKVNFNVRLTLIPSQPWVQCGSFLDLCYQARTIAVLIDPTGLECGVHSASIRAYDSENVAKGVLFEIPITVVQPFVLPPNETKLKFEEGIICKPNTILRNFILVPKNATWAAVRLIASDPEAQTGARFLIHTMQILPKRSCKQLESEKIIQVNNDVHTVHAFKCEENNILEVCIAKYWSNIGESTIRYTIDFHGIKSDKSIVMHSANGVHRLDLTTFSTEEVSPAVQLKYATMILKSTETKITPLGVRDNIPTGRQIYQHLFTYNLHLNKLQEISLYLPLLTSVLYESEYETQFWMMFDSNKFLVGSGDAYSKSKFYKLEKGDYVIKLQIRHEKKDLLEKLSDASMLVDFKLTTAQSLDFYSNFNQAVTQGKKLTAFSMSGNTSTALYIAPIMSEKLTKAGIPAQCSWLEGTITYAKNDFGRKCDTTPFQYMLIEGQPIKKPAGNGATPPKDQKTKMEEYKEQLRDFQTNQISKLDVENAEIVYNAIITEHPTYLQAHLALIQLIDSNTDLKQQLPFTFKKNFTKMSEEDLNKLKETLTKVVDLSNLIIKGTDQTGLLSFYGMKSDVRSDATKIKISMDKQKSCLLEAFVRKGVALSKLYLIGEDDEESPIDELNTIYIEIGKLIDYTDLKVAQFSLWHSFNLNYYGRMTKYLIKIYDEKLQSDALEELKLIAEEKEWKHISTALGKMVITSNPADYRLF